MNGGTCPKCQGALEPSEREGLPRRTCSGCGGVFVDVLHLESLAERLPIGDELVRVYSRLASQDLPLAGFDCPACGEGLLRGEYARVEVDACRRCKGLFFDRFELEGVLDPATTRPCPKCKAPMRAVEWNEVPANECRGCGGHWLDVRLLEAQPDVSRQTERALDALIDAFAIPPDVPSRPTDFPCPTCKRALEACHHEGIELDFCFPCRGLFLDAGEMKSITRLDTPSGGLKAGAQALERLVLTLRRLTS